MQFAELGLAQPILRALVSEAYETATPIQAQAIPPAMARRDILGCAQTGTGKTAAFALPILHRLAAAPGSASGAKPRALVLCPTRELANQIAQSFATYGKHLALRCAVIFGGVNQNPQAQAIRRGLDILVATPGRLLDLMNQGLVDLTKIEVLVLDEADRMLDMGFIHDIRRIVAKLRTERQTMLFSATMPTEVRRLAEMFLKNPAVVQVAHVAATADAIAQSVYFVPRRSKAALLAHLYDHLSMARTIVFTRTKHGADRVVRHLHSRGIRSEAIHGNKSQNARQRALENFRSNKTPVLVATDIASRGIDVDGITHVVNYDLTDEPETYVHRIGRTARAGASGVALSFCDPEELPNLKAIERLIRKPIAVCKDLPTFEAEPVHQQPARHANQHQPHRPMRHPFGGEQRNNERHAPASPARHPLQAFRGKSGKGSGNSFEQKRRWNGPKHAQRGARPQMGRR